MSRMITLAAQPFDFAFELNKAALVIIDMQRDFIEPGGFGASLGNNVTLLEAIVPSCGAVLFAWRQAGGLVLHTREAHLADLSNCPPAKRNRGNPNLRIGDLGPMGRVLVAGEPGKGMFYATPAHKLLQHGGITHLLFMGVTTEVCVQTSMREANDRGYDCLLLEDCTESYFAQFKQATLEMVRAQGAIVGWTATSRQLLGELHKSEELPG